MFDPELKEQLKAALDRDDLGLIVEILDDWSQAENPYLIKVELTKTQYDFAERMRTHMKMANRPSVIRSMLDSWQPAFEQALRDQKANP